MAKEKQQDAADQLLAELQERLDAATAEATLARAEATKLAAELAAAKARIGDFEATLPPAPKPTPKTVDPSSPVWLVEIAGCLLGKRYVAAANEVEAGEAYKKPCGIVSHAGPLNAMPCDFKAGNLPKGVELFGV